MNNLRIAISTLGCKTNFSESAAIFEQFPTAELVDFNEAADVYIINTCTVTNRTDYKSRNLIRKALNQKKNNPLAKVVVTGCFAQRSSEEIKALGAVDFVVDNQSKLNIADILAGQSYEFSDIMLAEDFSYRPLTNMLSRTRAFQKIQDGCDFYCAYCAVPYARGHSRSARFSDVLAQARLFVEHGFKEIVLGGVNIGLYRDGSKDLAGVVKALAQVSGLELIRISSIEPQLFTPDMLKALAQVPKLCPHFHIPLQSGSDTILKAMKRHYTKDLVAELCEGIHQHIPNAAIGLDVICGFPGEKEELFQETVDFIKELPITYLHVFSYSKRKGTEADTMPNQIPAPIKTQRANILSRISEEKKHSYALQLEKENVTLRGVVENGGEILSDHYLRYKLQGEHQNGSYVEIKVQECGGLPTNMHE